MYGRSFMRRAVALIMVSMFTFPIQAQQQAPAQQATTVQFQCRDLAAGGNYLGPDETIMNGMACKRVVVAAQPQASPAAAPQAAAPLAAPDAVSAPADQNAPSEAPAGQATPAGPSDQAPRAILLEDGTPIQLVLGENVSSADAVEGQTVAFEVVDDILVDGFIVIPRGSTAWATVTDTQHKRRMGRAGHVDLNIDKVRLADGEKALLRAVKNSQGGSNTGKMVGAMAVTAIFTLGGSALFLLAHGKDTTIPKGTN